jgi:hemerythrin superfamily protein
MVDEMAKRPKLNLSGSYFKDSYQAEIECLELKTKLVRDLMATLIDAEKRENQNTREYLEKSYRLLYEHMVKEWEYLEPEMKESELN